MTILIGLCGSAGSGKTTAAEYLANKYGARLYALADPIKQIVGKAFGLTHEQLWGTQEEKDTVDPRYNVSPRWLVRRVGTEGIRGVLGADTWIRHTFERIEHDAPPLAVIEDVRFFNEMQAVHDWRRWNRDAWLWKLETPWRPPSEDDHPSERELRMVNNATYHRVLAPAAKDRALLWREVDEACAAIRLLPLLHSIEAP